jgi:hypothetical protein
VTAGLKKRAQRHRYSAQITCSHQNRMTTPEAFILPPMFAFLPSNGLPSSNRCFVPDYKLQPLLLITSREMIFGISVFPIPAA